MGYKIQGISIRGTDTFLSVAPVINHYDYRFGVETIDGTSIIRSVVDLSSSGNTLFRRYDSVDSFLDADAIRIEDPPNNISNLYKSNPFNFEKVFSGGAWGFYFIGKINDKGFVAPNVMSVSPLYVQHNQTPQTTSFCSLDIVNRRSVFRISQSSSTIVLQVVGSTGSIPHNQFFFMKWIYYGKDIDKATHVINTTVDKNKVSAVDMATFDTIPSIGIYPMSKTGGGNNGAFHTKLNLLFDFSGLSEISIDEKDLRIMEILRRDPDYTGISL